MASTAVKLDRRAAFVAVLALLSITSAMALLLSAARMTDLAADSPIFGVVVRFSAVATIFGVFMFGGIMTRLVYFAIAQRNAGRPASRVLLTIIAKSCFLYPFFLLAAVNALDLLAHNLRPRWLITMEPEVRVLITLLYVGIIGSFTNFDVAVQRAEQTPPARIGLFYAIMAIVVASLVIAAIALSRE